MSRLQFGRFLRFGDDDPTGFATGGTSELLQLARKGDCDVHTTGVEPEKENSKGNRARGAKHERSEHGDTSQRIW
jgi:hypothetical protein